MTFLIAIKIFVLNGCKKNYISYVCLGKVISLGVDVIMREIFIVCRVCARPILVATHRLFGARSKSQTRAIRAHSSIIPTQTASFQGSR